MAKSRTPRKPQTTPAPTRPETEPQRAKEAVRQSEATSRALLDAMPDMLFTIARDGTFLGFVPGVAAEPLVPPAEFIGKKVPDVLPAEVADLIVQNMHRALESGQTQSIDYHLVQDGEVRYFEARLSPCGTDQVLAAVRDVTERRQAEEALRESEERFRDVLEVSRDLIYKLNLKTGAFDYVSPSVLQLTGFSPQEFTELGLQGVASRFHPETRGRVQAVLDNLPHPAIEADQFPEVEHRWKRKDGQYRWFRDSRALIRDEQGRAMALVSVATDITERKQAEEALRESEERFRSVAQTASDAIICIDSRGEIMLWNDAAKHVFGYSADEMGGRPLTCIMPERYREAHRNGMKRVAFTGQSGLAGKRVEMVGLRKDGSEFPAELSIATWTAAEGVFSTGIVRDITERKQAEDALRESEERFRLLAENAQDMVFRYRMAKPRGYDYISPAVATISGYTPEEFYADPFLVEKIIHADDREALDQLLRDLPTDPVELRWVRKDGSVVWTERRNVPIYDDAENLIALEGIVRDITERKRAEEALQRAREELEGRVEHAMLRRNPYGLTFRELTVLHLVAAGRADKEIASELGISPLTAHKHVSNILGKMEASSRTEAGVRAVREGLLD